MLKEATSDRRVAMLGVTVVVLTLALCSALVFCNPQTDNLQEFREPPEAGFVPDEVTAIKVAEALWLPHFGKEIYDSWPFTAELVDDSIWVVQGTLRKGPGAVAGGVPYVEILKRDCRVLILYHGE
jgi:hypothetical protein